MSRMPNQNYRPRTIRAMVAEVVSGVAVASLSIFALSSNLVFPHLDRTLDMVSSVVAVALILLILRWLPVSALRTAPLSRTRRRIGVLAYFGGWFGIFLLLEVHSLRAAIPEYLLACLGLISLALTVFLGAPVLFSSGESGRLGSLWTRAGIRLDERELHLRQKTFALTCRILIVSILLAGFLLTWIDLHHLLPDTPGGASALLPLAVLSFLGVAGIGLPSAILAWLEPDSSNAD